MIARQHCYCHCARAPRYIANSMAFNSVISSDVAHEGLRCPRSIAGFSVNKIGTELAALHGEQSAQMIPALESVVGGARWPLRQAPESRKRLSFEEAGHGACISRAAIWDKIGRA